MSERTDILIIGGGVIGCALALELSRRGREVTVVERVEPGCEASNAAAGVLAPQAASSGPGPLFDLKLAGKALFPEAAEDLRRETGIDVEYRAAGVLHLILSEDEEVEARERMAWQQERGLRAEWLSAREALAAEPCLAPEARGAIHYPDDHQINNARLVRALYQGSRKRGARYVLGNPVTELFLEGSRLRGASTPSERWEADAVVICAGSWSAEWSRRCGLTIPLSPVRGQMALASAAATPLRKVVTCGGCFLVPRVGGKILVGSTVESVGFDKRVTVFGVHGILGRALAAVPSLSWETLLATWAGLRPHCSDGLPLLGPIPGVQGAYLATGHFRTGILLSLITGRLMAQILDGEEPSVPVEPFSPARLSMPAADKNFRKGE